MQGRHAAEGDLGCGLVERLLVSFMSSCPFQCAYAAKGAMANALFAAVAGVMCRYFLAKVCAFARWLEPPRTVANNSLSLLRNEF
jgi:hypothetical protein